MKLYFLFVCLLCFDLCSFAGGKTPLTYNPVTQVYYQVSNDAQNLYLTVRADRPRIIQKILESGISFSTNHKNKNNKAIAFSYPVLREPVKSAVFDYISQALKGNPKERASMSDSLAKEGTKYLSMVDNQIKVAGLKLKDTLKSNLFRNKVPLFTESGQYVLKDNGYGIKVAANFSSERSYHYMLTVPLKLVNLRKGQTVKYIIKVNGRVIQSLNYHGETLRMIPSPGYSYATKPDPLTGKEVEVNADLNHPTEFLGSYTIK